MSDTITLSEADLFVRATLTWTPDPENPQPATINYVTRNGTAAAGEDYTAGSGTLTWAAGEGGSKSFDIPVIDDDAIEGDETFFIDISGDFNATVTVTLTDNDQALLSIVQSVNGNEGDPLTFTVSLDKALDHDIAVGYATEDAAAVAGQDYTAATGTVVIPAGQTSGTFSVATVEDTAQETLFEAFKVNISADDPQVALGDPSSSSGFIRDDDGANDPNAPPPPPTTGPGKSGTSSKGGNNDPGKGGNGEDNNTENDDNHEDDETGGNPGSNNRAPDAQDDTFSTREGTPITIRIADLLANDTDPDIIDRDPGDLRVIGIDTQVSQTNGTVVWNQAAGTITYTPPPDMHGTDVFQYRIADPKNATDVATVRLNVANADFDVVRIGIEQLSPNRQTVSDTNGDNEALVGIGPEVTGAGNAFTIDVSGDQIIIDFNVTGHFNNVPFIGYHIFDKYKQVPDMLGVTIESENVEGFDASDIDFKKNDIWINWADMSVTPDSRIVLDVDFA